jgi:hypothetical protein
MWAKILAATVAAVAAGGIGAYYALPNYSTGCCGDKSRQQFQSTIEETELFADDVTSSCGCCQHAKMESGSCCPSSSTSGSADAVGACTGPASLINAGTQAIPLGTAKAD